MRQLIYTALVAAFATYDPADDFLKAPGIADRIYPSGSLGTNGIPAEPECPYIQYGFDAHVPYPAVREGGGPKRHLARVWVYDKRGDYLRIDEIQGLVRQTIEGLTAQVSPSGVRCTDAMFLTLGGDLTDNVRNLNVKQSSYRLVAR